MKINPFTFRSTYSRFHECGHDSDGDFSSGNTCASLRGGHSESGHSEPGMSPPPKSKVHGRDLYLEEYYKEILNKKEHKDKSIKKKIEHDISKLKEMIDTGEHGVKGSTWDNTRGRAWAENMINFLKSHLKRF